MFDLAQKLLSLSQQMLSCAENSEWENLADIQTKRAEIIRQLDTLDLSSLDQPSSVQLSELLTQSRDLEQRCMQLTETAQGKLTAEQVKVSKGKAMRKAYGAHSNRR